VKFVSNRDTVVRSMLIGQSIEFKKGVPQDVPYAMRAEVLEKGIVPVEDTGEPLKAQTTVVAAERKVMLPPEGEERVEKILSVFEAIIARNNPSDFAGGGCPGALAVSAGTGFKVDQKEVRGLWEKHRNKLLNRPAL